MNDFLNNVKKHGALGVLAMWLWITHARVERLEEKLYECYEDKNISYVMPDNKIIDIRIFAVLPNEIKYDFKRIRKQTTTS